MRLELCGEGGDAKAFFRNAHLKSLVTQRLSSPAHGAPLQGMIRTSETMKQCLVLKRVLEEQSDVLDEGDDGGGERFGTVPIIEVSFKIPPISGRDRVVHEA